MIVLPKRTATLRIPDVWIGRRVAWPDPAQPGHVLLLRAATGPCPRDHRATVGILLKPPDLNRPSAIRNPKSEIAWIPSSLDPYPPSPVRSTPPA